MNDFWQFFYKRLASVRHPIFKFRELEVFPREDWQPLIDSKVLVRSSEPETIIDEKGIELMVRRSDDRIFGVDISSEVPSIKPLEDADVIHYGVSAFALLKMLREVNRIEGNGSKEDNGLHYIGTKNLPESGDCRVFLAIGCNHTDSLEQRLHALADPTSTALVVFPVNIGISHTGKLSVIGVFTATLEGGLQIHWPQNIQLGYYSQNAINREFVETVEEYSMCHTGSSWTINFLGYEFSVKDNLGTRYIAHLLAHPSTVFDVSQLKNFMSSKELDQDNTNDSTTEAEGSIEVSTKENLIRLKSRQRELESEREHETNQVIIAEIDEELETINAEFKRILSHSGQIRRESGTSDKDRKSVSNAVRRGIYKQVENCCPACKKYFENRIDLGFQCMFVPAEGEVWKIRFSQKSSMLHKM